MTVAISSCGIGLADIPQGFEVGQPLAYIGECQCGQGGCVVESFDLHPEPCEVCYNFHNADVACESHHK